MASNLNPMYADGVQQIENHLSFEMEDNPIQEDALTLDISDDELAKTAVDRIDISKKWFDDKYSLTDRREKNETYLFGRQVGKEEKEGKYKEYQTRSSDNVLYEIESSLKPLAMSKLPDIIITPGEDDTQRIKSAKDLTLVIDTENKKREMRETLGLAFKHVPVYFGAVIKARWDSQKGKHGDYRFDVINPEYIVVDHTATSGNVDDMSFIAQSVPMTLQDILMKFPKRKKDIFEKLKIDQEVGPSHKELATEYKTYEIWFDWYKKVGSSDILTKTEFESPEFAEEVSAPEDKWELVCGVVWTLEKLFLEKRLDPNYDHEGETKVYAYPIPGDAATKLEVTEEDMLMAAIGGIPIPGMTQEQVFFNYFERPHKPFYFMGYDKWGKTVWDETSRIEQNIRNQENIDDQNRTVIDQLKTRIKHVWGTASGLERKHIQRMDMDDPKIDALVEGNPNDVHKSIPPERPDSAQYKNIDDTRSRMYGVSGTNAIRGTIQSDTATSNQIAREADYNRTDDLVEDTINAASEWLANWQMQFIKLRYTREHLKEVLGSRGQIAYVKLRRDTIADGMEVRIGASSTDKLKAQRNAMETAGLGPPFTNPVDFFIDMGMNDPEGRTEKGMLFAADPMTYFTKYVLQLDDTQKQAMALNGQLPQITSMGPDGQPVPPAGPLGPPSEASGGLPDNRQQPTPGNTASTAGAPPVGVPQGSPRAL